MIPYRQRIKSIGRAVATIAGAALAGVCLVSLPALAETASPGPEPPACALQPGPTRAVTSVIDAETLRLDDGTEVRLIGALAPRPPDGELDVSFWPPERDARRELERLVLGRSVTLAFAGRRSDRYGRLLAHVMVEPSAAESVGNGAGERIWVQAHMLQRGHARAYVLKENTGCLRELSVHEAYAQAHGLGLWSNAAYRTLDAGRTWELMRLRSTFQIVEGGVTAVIVARTALILRFGFEADKRDDQPSAGSDDKPAFKGFSLVVKPAIVRVWAERGLTAEALGGRRLRVHGWIERRGGPSIEILDAHQIEFADDNPIAVNSDIGIEMPTRRSRKAGREAAFLSPPVRP